MSANYSLSSKVLVVDNDPKTLRILEMRLKNEGYKLTLATNGRQALQRFEETDPDLVLVDVNMPGMSGLEVLSEIKLISPETPVVVMTAFSSEEVAVDAVKKGANDYVTKPFNSKEICQVVKENIERSRAWRDRRQLLKKLEASSNDLTEKVKELERHNLELIESIKVKSGILSELEDTNKKLRELSIRDGLTNLYNHAYFQERLSEEFNRSKRYDNNLSFIMVDIDNFKQINDRFGHQMGDRILVELSNLLMESIRGIDIAARYGGEEFVLILPQIDAQNAKQMAERIRHRVNSYFSKLDGKQLNITISQGIASIPHPRINTKTDLIRAADNALYRAKQKGKNVVEITE